MVSNSSVFLTHTLGSGWKKKKVECILWQQYQSNIRLLMSTYPQAEKWKKPAIIVRVFVQISPPSVSRSARRAVDMELPGHWLERTVPHLAVHTFTIHTTAGLAYGHVLHHDQFLHYECDTLSKVQTVACRQDFQGHWSLQTRAPGSHVALARPC